MSFHHQGDIKLPPFLKTELIEAMGSDRPWRSPSLAPSVGGPALGGQVCSAVTARGTQLWGRGPPVHGESSAGPCGWASDAVLREGRHTQSKLKKKFFFLSYWSIVG